MPLTPGSRLGPYEILAPLGAGGMGEVYRARDTKLKREVAVKVLPQALAQDADALARFEREALAVAALSHPNILSIFDFGTQDGTTYAVMELLEGETLRGRLALGPVSPKQAVDWALQIAKGLSSAHERGVVHRDLKPENLFVAKDGHLKILDFGLAKRGSVAAPGEETSAPTASQHTEPGTVMGTVGYMSPEQVRGLPVDHRSDIFSFGAVLYEMISGNRAFQGSTPADTMSAILKEEPPELSGSGRPIPAALDNIVRHCLEKDRDNRFQSAKDIAFALSEQSTPAVAGGAQFAAPDTGRKKVFLAAAILIVLAFAGIVVSRQLHKEGGGEAGAVKRVVVLPFENMGSAEDDYLADGMTDEVRSKLTMLPGFLIIARASSVPYKKTTKTPNQIAQELDVRYLLTATVRWQKSAGISRVHVNPELIEVSGSGAPVSRWEQGFDASLTDVFQTQSDIASQVAHALGVALGPGEEKRLSDKPTQNLAAYDAFLKGDEANNSMNAVDAVSMRKALGFYEQAVALDPGFSQAWARVSRASSGLYFNSVPTPELAERARQAAERAVALAPNRPEGYVALGNYELFVVKDEKRALDIYARGLRLAPADADLIRGMGFAERDLGRWDAAMEHWRQAEQLDPRSIRSPVHISRALFRLRRFQEARKAADRGLAFAPGNLELIEAKAVTFLGEGDLEGARAVIRTAPKEVDATKLVIYLADNAWVLDEQQRELLLRLTPTAFDDDRGAWGLSLAKASALKGDVASVRRYAAEAKKAIEGQILGASENADLHAALGSALAYLGQKTDAIREGERGVALQPVARYPVGGPYLQNSLVQIYVLVGEPEKALDQLEPLLKVPCFLSPGWLKIDPNFDPLRKNPRFQKLIAGS